MIRSHIVVAFSIFAATIAINPCGVAHAEPILLAEWTRDQPATFVDWRQPTLPSTVPFTFTSLLYTSPSVFIGGDWTQQIGHASVGATFEAPPAIVNLLDDTFLGSGVRFGGGVGNFNSFINDLSNWLIPPGGNSSIGFYTQHVPQLHDYRVGRLTRTIDSVILEWVPNATGRAYYLGGQQTVRLYGQLIPEPGSIALGLVALMFISAIRPTNRSRLHTVHHCQDYHSDQSCLSLRTQFRGRVRWTCC